MFKKVIKAVGELIIGSISFVVFCVGAGFWWSVAKAAFSFGSF